MKWITHTAKWKAVIVLGNLCVNARGQSGAVMVGGEAATVAKGKSNLKLTPLKQVGPHPRLDSIFFPKISFQIFFFRVSINTWDAHLDPNPKYGTNTLKISFISTLRNPKGVSASTTRTWAATQELTVSSSMNIFRS